jgi:hypothetical protein
MSQQQQPLKAYTEADVQLALLDIKRDHIASLRRAEEVYLQSPKDDDTTATRREAL